MRIVEPITRNWRVRSRIRLLGPLDSTCRKYAAHVARRPGATIAYGSDDLNQVERHRGNLVIRLQGLVDQALRTLTRAQRMSKLPRSLGDWSGEEFLRIKFASLEGDALAYRLGEVIDEAAVGKDAAGKAVSRDGFSILFRGVAACSATRVPRRHAQTRLRATQ